MGILNWFTDPHTIALTKAGPWAATRVALRAYLATTYGQPTPHTMGVMDPAPSLVSTSGSDLAPAAPYAGLTKLALLPSSPYIASEGGQLSYQPQAGYYRSVVTSLPSGQLYGVGRHTIVTDATIVGVCVQGHVSNRSCSYRVLINDQYVSMTATEMLLTGRNWLVIDMTALGLSGQRKVTVEIANIAGYAMLGSVRGFAIATGDTYYTPPARPCCLVFSDSFGEATGATVRGEGFTSVLGDALGMEMVSSSDGGTGYIANDGGGGYALPNRIVADLARHVPGRTIPLVLVPLGVNDLALGDITAAAVTCRNAIRAALPAALIGFAGPWNVTAPTQSAGNLAAEAALRSVAAAPGCFFVDVSDLAFTKSGDGVHPSDAGHATIAGALDASIRLAVG